MPRYDEQSAREAVATSHCYSDALKKLGLRPAGGNHQLFRRYVDEVWKIPTAHFDSGVIRNLSLRRAAVPLTDVLVEGSSYSRATLKRRLYDEGLKLRQCEMCGQGEEWRGSQISLILDHVNGVPDDNRLENLRILCPNCNSSLETHCARKNRLPQVQRACGICGAEFSPRSRTQKYCSRECGQRHRNRAHGPRIQGRKVERPSYEQLKRDVAAMSMCAAGRKYGMSDNAVRKWLRWYAADSDGGQQLPDPAVAEAAA